MRIATLTSLLLIPFVAGCGSESKADTGKNDPLSAPLGLAKAELAAIPADNPLTAAKVELGKQLFFDPRLSNSGTMSCASCHHTDKAFTDGQALSKKDNGGMNSRNSPTMYNVGYYPDLYWDGRKQGLESNILAAWTGQLGGEPAAVAEKLNAVAGYQQQFQQAFQKPADETTIVQALASFLRVLRSGNSPYDRFQGGDKTALSAAAQAGWDLFKGKAGCQMCHQPPLFTDRLFHNVGIGMTAEKPDMGRANATKDPQDNGKFKTPTLREIAKTAPYFHDGSVATLREAVKLMAAGGIANEHQQPVDKAMLMNKNLSDEEIDQLVAFLESLSGDVPFQTPELPK